MQSEAEPDDVIYYGHVVEQLRSVLTDDPREPDAWSDGDKLRLLAALFDEADLAKGISDHLVQDDLRRMADVLDALKALL